jgi:hypothetical protein
VKAFQVGPVHGLGERAHVRAIYTQAFKQTPIADSCFEQCKHLRVAWTWQQSLCAHKRMTSAGYTFVPNNWNNTQQTGLQIRPYFKPYRAAKRYQIGGAIAHQESCCNMGHTLDAST